MNKPALIFDMDDTLYARQDPFMAAIAQFAAEDRPDFQAALAAADPGKLFTAFLHYGYDLYEASMNGEVSMEEMYTYRMTHALADFDMPVSDEEALQAQNLYLQHQAHISLDPWIAQALDAAVEKNIFLAVISNGKSDHQRDKYRAMQLQRYFPAEQFMASGDIGVSKPDPVIFQTAVDAWKLTPETTWYIGDSYAHDIEAAAPFGWHTIWLDRGESKDALPGSVVPDHIVHSTRQLKDVLLQVIREMTE